MNSGKTNFSNNLGDGEYQQQMQDGEREMIQNRDTGSSRNYGARPKVSLLLKRLTIYWILRSTNISSRHILETKVRIYEQEKNGNKRIP